MTERVRQLLHLSRDLGRPERRLAILGEGNSSCRVDDETFLVKASGSTLETLDEGGLTRCRFAPILEAVDRETSDAEALTVLEASKVNPAARRSSVETGFHAWLLTRPGVAFVAHTHPESCNAILCSPRADEFASRRSLPDEIVVGGVESVLVPYVDPGFALARAIRDGVIEFEHKHGHPPRVILLRNHGVITLGASAEAARAAMLMCDKAARIFLAAAALSGPIFLGGADVARIEGREDEAYRRRALKL